jgi:hypothetical protein
MSRSLREFDTLCHDFLFRASASDVGRLLAIYRSCALDVGRLTFCFLVAKGFHSLSRDPVNQLRIRKASLSC